MILCESYAECERVLRDRAEKLRYTGQGFSRTQWRLKTADGTTIMAVSTSDPSWREKLRGRRISDYQVMPGAEVSSDDIARIIRPGMVGEERP